MGQSKVVNFSIGLYAIVFICFLYEYVVCNLNFTLLDEIFILILILRWINISQGEMKPEFLAFICIAFLFLIISISKGNNVTSAIYMDFIIQCKPYIAFYCVVFAPFLLDDTYKKYLRYICLGIAAISLPLGLLYVVGKEEPLTIFYAHPSRFATTYEFLAIAYLMFSKKTKWDIIISIIIMCAGLCSLRSKLFAFITLYACMLLFDKRINYRHLFSLKNIIFVVIAISLSVYFAWEKIQFYFLQGTETSSEFTMFARAQLYYSSIEIMHDNPFFGTGFGSYATEASAKYYSPIYSQYNLDLNPEIGNGMFLSDTFFPSLAQIGLIGIFLFLTFWYSRLVNAYQIFKKTGNRFPLKFTILITVFFFIESVADTTYTNNRGVLMMMCLGIIQGDIYINKEYKVLLLLKLINNRLNLKQECNRLRKWNNSQLAEINK